MGAVMLRRTPLSRKTPLSRGSAGLKKVKIAPRSRKARGKASGRKDARSEVIERADGKCQLRVPGFCLGRGTDVHEVLPRSAGGDPNDPGNCLLACNPCHMWAHEHPAQARKLGWLKSRYPGKE